MKKDYDLKNCPICDVKLLDGKSHPAQRVFSKIYNKTTCRSCFCKKSMDEYHKKNTGRKTW